jgi:hypothetical protein
MKELVGVLAEEYLGLPPEDRTGGRIGVGDAAVGAEADDPLADRVQELLVVVGELLELALADLALGEIAHERHPQLGCVSNASDRQLGGELGPVRSPAGNLETPPEDRTPPALDQPLEAGPVALAVVRRNQELGHVSADGLLGWVAEDLLRRAIEGPTTPPASTATTASSIDSSTDACAADPRATPFPIASG